MMCGQDQVRLGRLIVIALLIDQLLIMVLMMRVQRSIDLYVHAVGI